MRAAIRRALPALAFLLAGAALSTESLLYSQNTLFNNGRWIVQKRMIRGCPQDEPLLTRMTLAGNQLDLGAWNRHQEVISRVIGIPKRVSFRFRLEENSYLDFTFNRSGSYSGLRLSRIPVFPGFAFESDISGKFLSTQKIPGLVLSDGWHDFELESSGAALALSIDRGPPMSIPNFQFEQGAVGLRGGFGSARVKDIAIDFSDGKNFRDAFRNSESWPRIFSIHFAALMLLTVFFSALPLRKTARGIQAFLKRWTKLALASALFFLLWFCFDFTYWSMQPSRFFVPTSSPESDPLAERIRYSVFSGWSRLLGAKAPSVEQIVREGYVSDTFGDRPSYCGPSLGGCKLVSRSEFEALGEKKKSGYRVLIIGGSATAGCGASTLENASFVRLYHWLNSKSSLPAPVEIFNAATFSYVSSFDEYKKNQYLDSLRRFSPDLVIAQRLVLKDTKQEMEQFLASIDHVRQRDGAAAVLVLAEFDPEAFFFKWDGFRVTNQSLRSIALERNLPVLDPEEIFGTASIMDGAQWWDVLHPNDYGHERFAAWLAPKISGMLEKRSRPAR